MDTSTRPDAASRAPVVRARSQRSRLLAAALLAALGACVIPKVRAEEETIRHPYYGLEEAQPADIAVAPVRDASSSRGAPVAAVRSALYEGLVARQYSPLELSFVDAHWSEAGFAADSLDVGGVLEVVFREWDLSLLGTHGVILAEVEARVLDGRRPGAEPLWGLTLKRRLRVANDVSRVTRTELYARAGERLADEVLRNLPLRTPDPVAGR